MQLIRSVLMLLAFGSLTTCERSTIERIRKHQEWLQQRNNVKPLEPTLSTLRKAYEVANLWKFNKDSWQKSPSDDPRNNDVYPENEVVESTTETTRNTTTASMMMSTTALSIQWPTTVRPTRSTTATTRRPISRITSTRSPWTTTTTRKTTTTRSPKTTSTTIMETSTISTSEISPTTTENSSIVNIRTSNESSFVELAPTIPKKPKMRQYPRWGNWSEWTDCSRTCGGGVMWQQRKCISRRQNTGKRFISNECVGIYRRYHLCNEQACPSTEIDFRQQQCSHYDNVVFQGRKYTWQPYIKDDAECELNCRPTGMKYFATLNTTVIDGTACYRPAEYYRVNYRDRAMCVGGICKMSCACCLVDKVICMKRKRAI